MVQLAYTPQWFYDKDIIIDLVVVFVIALLAFFSFRYYRIDKRNKNYFYFAVSFIFLALSFIAKILTNFTIYHNIVEVHRIGNITLTYHELEASSILFFGGFFFYRLLTLLGLYLLYSIYQRKQSKSTGIFIIYLLLVSTYFSSSAYYFFHITVFILLLLIIFEYASRYRETHYRLTKWLAASFAVIASSNLLFMFVAKSAFFYVFAEVVQLLGYLTLLATFIRVLRLGKKG